MEHAEKCRWSKGLSILCLKYKDRISNNAYIQKPSSLIDDSIKTFSFVYLFIWAIYLLNLFVNTIINFIMKYCRNEDRHTIIIINARMASFLFPFSYYLPTAFNRTNLYLCLLWTVLIRTTVHVRLFNTND